MCGLEELQQDDVGVALEEVKSVSQPLTGALAWPQVCPHAVLLIDISAVQVSMLVQPSFGISCPSPAAHGLMRRHRTREQCPYNTRVSIPHPNLTPRVKPAA